MKRILTTLTLALSIVLLGSVKNTASAQPGVDVSISYQSFYDELSPYGRWIDYPEYGYVWAPNLGPEFQPYSSGGQWVWSDEYDWMWVSDYSWGWAPFHYGRWFQDDYYGWMWEPGYEWSPAWVSWRTGGDYYGWAPLRPGISISIGFGNYNPPYNYWCFAPRQYINHRNIGSYCIDRSRNITIINNTTIINNYGNRNNVFVNGGPRRGDAEQYAGRIRPVNFRETNRPGDREFRNNRVSVYRPQIQRDNDRRIAPRNFDRYNRDGQNNGTGIRRDGNNQPDRRGTNNNRGFDRRDNDTRQPGNNNNDIANRRRDIFNRDNDRSNNRDVNRPNDQRPVTADRSTERRNVFDRNRNNDRSSEQREIATDRPIDRRNVFDRNRNNERLNTQQPVDDRRRERPDINNRNTNRPADNNQREERTFERRAREVPQVDRRSERRDVFERNNNSNQQPERREIRNEPGPQQRQPQPQIDRQPQREPRQFENRGSEQRNNNNGGGRVRSGRRD